MPKQCASFRQKFARTWPQRTSERTFANRGIRATEASKLLAINSMIILQMQTTPQSVMLLLLLLLLLFSLSFYSNSIQFHVSTVFSQCCFQMANEPFGHNANNLVTAFIVKRQKEGLKKRDERKRMGESIAPNWI